MRIPEIPGADAETERALHAAGIANASQLSRVEDLTTLAERSGIAEPKLQELRDAARATIERRLHDAGVADERALVDADLARLAERTGIPLVELVRFRELARRAVGLEDEPARVELRDGASDATLHVGDTRIEALPLVTASDAFESYHGDAVLVTRDAPTATARYAGALRAGVPLVVGDAPVRVLDVRARAASAAPTKGDPFWWRILKR